MTIKTGPLWPALTDLIDCLTGATVTVRRDDWGMDDDAPHGCLDAPEWIPAGSHRVASGVVFAECSRPGRRGSLRSNDKDPTTWTA